MARPRSSDSAVLDATIDLIAEQGESTVTVDAVADRSGVSRPTIYRRWGTRDKLIRAAFGCLEYTLVEADTGSVRGDLVLLLRQLVGYLNRTRVLPSLMEAAARDPEVAALRESVDRRGRAAYARAVRRGIERGELPAGTDIDLFVDLALAPFIYRRVTSQALIELGYIAPVVDRVLVAFGQPSNPLLPNGPRCMQHAPHALARAA
jgi:AcrR family transcriptional regulator